MTYSSNYSVFVILTYFNIIQSFKTHHIHLLNLTTLFIKLSYFISRAICPFSICNFSFSEGKHLPRFRGFAEYSLLPKLYKIFENCVFNIFLFKELNLYRVPAVMIIKKDPTTLMLIPFLYTAIQNDYIRM